MKIVRLPNTHTHRLVRNRSFPRGTFLAVLFAVAVVVGCDRSPKPVAASQPVSTAPGEAKSGESSQTGSPTTASSANNPAQSGENSGSGLKPTSNPQTGTPGSGASNSSSGGSGQSTGTPASNGTPARAGGRDSASDAAGDLNPADAGEAGNSHATGGTGVFPGKGGSGRSTELAHAPTGVQLPQLNPLDLPKLPRLPNPSPTSQSAAGNDLSKFSQILGRWRQADGPLTPDIAEGGYTSSTLIFRADGSFVIERAFDAQREVVLLRRFVWQLTPDGRLHIEAVKLKDSPGSFSRSIKLSTGGLIVPPETRTPADLSMTNTAKTLKLFDKNHIREAN